MTKSSRHTTQHDEDRSPEDADVPTSLLAFVRRFPTDEACADYLFDVRYPDGYRCIKCGSTKAWPAGPLRKMICENKHKISITAGTVLHRTKQPLTTWFYAAYLVATLTPGISAVQFQKQLGLTRYETAFQMLHKLRSALVAPDREPLRGEVEIDEAFVGGVEKGRPGRGADSKALVVVAVEVVHWEEPDPENPDEVVQRRRAGRARMSVLPDASAATLTPWVQKNVAVEGSTVVTDGWAGYNGLSALGYDHRRVLQSRRGQKTGHYLPMVHLIISNLKRWLLGTHKGAVRPKHLQAYLNEFVFRFNRRFWRGPAFLRALGLASAAGAPEWAELYAAGEPDGWAHPNPSREGALFALVREEAAHLDDPGFVGWMDANRERLLAEIRKEIVRQGREGV